MEYFRQRIKSKISQQDVFCRHRLSFVVSHVCRNNIWLRLFHLWDYPFCVGDGGVWIPTCMPLNCCSLPLMNAQMRAWWTISLNSPFAFEHTCLPQNIGARTHHVRMAGHLCRYCWKMYDKRKRPFSPPISTRAKRMTTINMQKY